MFGHIEEPHELAEHMRVVRALQERTGGFTEFVPLSFIPFNTLLGRTHGIEEISREENLKHTAAFRLALGRSVPSLQASWVKMGLDAATEALRWGVNDLGGTLMEESISRMAGSYHGVKLDPEDLVAAAHRAGRPAAERTTLYELRRALPGRRGRGLTGSALELGRRLAAGELEPVALAEEALARARAAGCAFIALTEERALREAAASAARLRAGAPRGPLDGVPVAWKDLVDVEGVGTTAALGAAARRAAGGVRTRRWSRGSRGRRHGVRRQDEPERARILGPRA